MLSIFWDIYICGSKLGCLMKVGQNTIKRNTLFIITFAVLFQFIACKPTRWVESGDYLLQKNKIEIDNKDINKKGMESYLRQSPNKRFLLIFKFRLATYNFSKLGKERKWKKWIRRVIGEEPAVYDSILVVRTEDQFTKYLKNEAYYDALVGYNVKFHKKKARVIYNISTGKPVTIKNVNYEIEDTALQKLVFSDTSKSFLVPHQRMTFERLENERERIVNQLLNNGYFGFSPDYIRYIVDTLNRKAKITLVLKKALKKDSLNNLMEVPHRKYWINKVYFLPDFDPQKSIRNRQSYFNTFDTTYFKGYGFIYPGRPNIKPKVIFKANNIKQGDLYNFTKVNSTTDYLNSLRLFRLNYLNWQYDKNSDSLINCMVQLTPSVYQNYSVNFETTNTQGNFGIGGYLNYEHKNLLRGAEIFNFKVSGSLQRQVQTPTSDAFNIAEYGAEASLETPSFILPVRLERFYKKYKPKTSFALSFNYQDRPDYSRTIYNTNMAYNWKGSENIRHIVSPIDIGSVVVSDKHGFLDSIRGTYLENSYKDYLIIGANYSLFYQNKPENANHSFSYFRWNVGIAGNLLHLLDKNFGLNPQKDTSGYYTMFNLQYAQYVLSDIDYRYNFIMNKDNSLVMRAFAGAAVPYGNATGIPFVKQYYAGGAEGIRAWHARDLGPGTFRDTLQSYPNQTSDIKLEANIEYRYSLNNNWKGALFIDAGNIWSISKYDKRPGAVFDFNTFYKQLAIGTGFGIRYDLDFAVFRVDWGIKVRDPNLSGSESWVLFHHENFKLKDLKDMVIWHFAVGYPF